MSNRKQTPDILADLLGGSPQADAIGDAGLQPEAPQINHRLAQPSTTARFRPKAQRSAKPKSIHPAPETAQRQSWEHRVASFQDHKGWRLRFVDGLEVNDWAVGMLLQEYVAKMAEDGWQVAGACAGQTMFGVLDKYQIYLKRPA